MQVLFAGTASLLVKEYALYAKHSGIPEIKTVLGGFVLRRFLGAWTLGIKSLGLVSAILCNTDHLLTKTVSCRCFRNVAW